MPGYFDNYQTCGGCADLIDEKLNSVMFYEHHEKIVALRKSLIVITVRLLIKTINRPKFFLLVAKLGLICLVPVIDDWCVLKEGNRQSTTTKPPTMFHVTGFGSDTVFYYD